MPNLAKDPKTGQFLTAEETARLAAAENKGTDKPKDEIKPEAAEDMPGVRMFVDRTFGGDGKQETAKPKAKVKELKKPEEKPKPEIKPKPEEKPRQDDSISRAAGALERAADAISRSNQEAKPDEKPKPEEKKGTGLPPDEQKKYDVLQHMEKFFGDKYKGHAEKYKGSIEKLIAYADEWKKANPGKKFNEADPEHEPFFDDNNVDWEDDDYIEALVDMKTSAALEKERRQNNEKLTELERKEALREAAPLIDKEQVGAAKALWKAFGDEFADIINPDGSVNVDKIKELKKTDPMGVPIRVAAAKHVDTLVAETYKLLNGFVKFDENKPVHVYLNDFALQLEEALMQKPEDERKDDGGRLFKPREIFNALSQKEQKKVWTFGVSDLAVLLANDEARKAAEFIATKEEEFNSVATAKGFSKAATTEKGRIEQEVENEEEEELDDEKPNSPSAASVPKVAASQKKTATEEKSGSSAFGEKLLGAS